MNKRLIPAVVTAALMAVTTAWYTPAAYSANTIAAAARAGDLAESKLLIDSGADVNLAEPDGSTPLLWATYQSSMELVQLLLDAGADPNVSNGLDITPLLQASRYGNAEMIAALLAEGATLSGAVIGVETSLMAAARSGSVAAVEILLDAGAEPDRTELLDNQTALMWATVEGHLDVARALLDAGANADARARVSELTKRKNADFPSGGFAALHWAARNGDIPMINLLIESGADINIRNGDDSTPMMLAIVNDRFDIAAMLLELDADPNDGSLYYITEMRDATTDWRARDGTVFRADYVNVLSALDFTRLLLEADADPNQPFIGQMHNASMCCDTSANATPFFRAAIAADVEALKLMLDYGADTEWTPVQKEGVTGTPQGNIGKTALMVAINGGKGVGVAGGPNDLRQGPAPFREISNRKPFDAITVLIDAGADVHFQNLNEETALHVAANAGELDIVHALIASGASLVVENKDGWTPQQLVENTPAPEPRVDRYVREPQAQKAEMIAALKDLASLPGDNIQ